MDADAQKRAKGDQRDIFSFLFLSQEFYEDLRRYQPSSSEYLKIVTASLPSHWNIRKQGIWYSASVIGVAPRPDGFKIHVSATMETAPRILAATILPIVEENTPFKFLADRRILRFTLMKRYPRTAAGKFLVAYPPSDAAFRIIIDKLYLATKQFSGPHVLTDRPYKDSESVFYRFGNFSGLAKMTTFGEKAFTVSTPDGREIEDKRVALFVLPEGITDPFPKNKGIASNTALLNGRYRVEKAIAYANSGGVYEAWDSALERKVIIKEARPHIMVTAQRDAQQTLMHERDVLTKLRETEVVPKVVEHFQQWKHTFLVQERARGVLFSQYSKRRDVCLIRSPLADGQFVRQFTERFVKIAIKLIDAVLAIHQQGIVIGDISPNNIFTDPESFDVTFVDLEAAEPIGQKRQPHEFLATAGFASREKRKSDQAEPLHDWYALGRVLFTLLFPAVSFFDLEEAAEEKFRRALVSDYRLPPEIGGVIAKLQSGDVADARVLLQKQWRLSSRVPPDKGQSILPAEKIKNVLDGISTFLLSNLRPERSDALWPPDYRAFSTNPLSVAFGACGAALFLYRHTAGIPAVVEQWILTQPLSHSLYPAGLYVGLSGIAWAFSKLGYTERALAVMDLANESPIANETVDIFYGSSGLGLANLHFWKLTKAERYLEKARAIGIDILSKQERDKTGPYWLNTDGREHFGYAHGNSGIAYFLLQLGCSTRDMTFVDCAVEALKHEIEAAQYDKFGISWPMIKGNTAGTPYWRFGNAGVGSVLIRFYHLLHDPYYKELATKVADYIRIKYAAFPGQFVGMAGIGEFFIDLHSLSGEQEALQQAHSVAEAILLFEVKRPSGTAFPGDEVLRLSCDFGAGSAGVGLYLSRLMTLRPRDFYCIDETPSEGESYATSR